MANELAKGKLPTKLLKDIIFKHIGVRNDNIVLGPNVGEDAAIVKINKKLIILTTDPITGAIEDLGRLAININANDIGAFGVRPKYFLATILLPVKSTIGDLKRIVAQLDENAKKLGISIIGGHTEVTDVVKQPIIVGFMIGETEIGQYAKSSGAVPGDHIILTKYAGIEGTAILAEDCAILNNFLTAEELSFAKSLKFMTSVVEDGVTALDTKKVTAMHDPTEGGIVGALYEIASASKVGFKVYEERIPFYDVTLKICNFLDIDPLRLISSGALLITTNDDETVIKALKKKGINATTIGEILDDETKKMLIRKTGKIENIDDVPTDELWSALDKCKKCEKDG